MIVFMNRIDRLVSKILDKYHCFELPEEKKKEAFVFEDHLYLKCYANTYSTDNYIVVRSELENISKREFIAMDNIPPMNKYGFNKEKMDTYDISSPNFNLSGVGAAIAIFKVSSLEIEQVFYFSESLIDSICLQNSTNLAIIVDREAGYTYVIKLDDFQEDFYLTIKGISKVYGNYLVVFPEDPYDNYDVQTSISLVDLKSQKEYILSDELKKKGIEAIDCSNSIYDEKNNILSICSFDDNKITKFSLSYIKRHCIIKELESTDNDSRLPGCCTTEIGESYEDK